MKFSEAFVSHGDLEAWSQLAEEIGGQFLRMTPEYVTRGGTGSTVHLKVEKWSISLEAFRERAPADAESGVEQVRLRAPYEDRDGFRFTIYRKNLLTGIGKLFGAQDVETGDAAFDDEFVVKSNDEAKARALFAKQRLRELVRAQPYVYFQIRDGETSPGKTLLGAAAAELYFLLRYDQMNDVARLKSLFELFAETLRQLRAIGSA